MWKDLPWSPMKRCIYNPQNETLHFFKSKRYFLQNETASGVIPLTNNIKEKQGSQF